MSARKYLAALVVFGGALLLVPEAQPPLSAGAEVIDEAPVTTETGQDLTTTLASGGLGGVQFGSS